MHPELYGVLFFVGGFLFAVLIGTMIAEGQRRRLDAAFLAADETPAAIRARAVEAAARIAEAHNLGLTSDELRALTQAREAARAAREAEVARHWQKQPAKVLELFPNNHDDEGDAHGR